MYDQTVRSLSGGRMLKKLSGKIVNEDFIFERIGEEGKSLRKHLKLQGNISKENIRYSKNLITGNIYTKIKRRLKKYLVKKLGIDEQAMELGKFRLSGEIHQWMYDRYSLSNLLKICGGKDIHVKTAFTSNINNWVTYNLDAIDSEIRKPDSLFMEAIK